MHSSCQRHPLLLFVCSVVSHVQAKAVELLEHAEGVFRRYARENVQASVLMRVAYLSEPRQTDLVRWLDAVVRVMLRLRDGPFFAFSPDMFVHIVLSGYHALNEHGEDLLGDVETPRFFRLGGQHEGE
jgi:hypothetical protein